MDSFYLLFLTVYQNLVLFCIRFLNILAILRNDLDQ